MKFLIDLDCLLKENILDFKDVTIVFDMHDVTVLFNCIFPLL